MTMRLVNWNVEWATPRSQRTPEIRRRIGQHTPDIVCLTETHTGLLCTEGDVIYSQPDSGRLGLDLNGWVGIDANGYRFGPEMLSATEDGKWVS